MGCICTRIDKWNHSVAANHGNVEIMVFSIMAKLCSPDWAGVTDRVMVCLPCCSAVGLCTWVNFMGSMCVIAALF